MTATAINVNTARPTVRCQTCKQALFDGVVIKARVIRLLPQGGAEAKCRCKAWVRIPVCYCETIK